MLSRPPNVPGGGGRAKGLGGPDAPALNIALALGEGGGRTTPVLGFRGVSPVVPVSLGEESAVALPVSDCSLGICTFNLGRLGSLVMLLVRDGGAIVGTEDTDEVRCGWWGNCEDDGRGDAPFCCCFE